MRRAMDEDHLENLVSMQCQLQRLYFSQMNWRLLWHHLEDKFHAAEQLSLLWEVPCCIFNNTVKDVELELALKGGQEGVSLWRVGAPPRGGILPTQLGFCKLEESCTPHLQFTEFVEKIEKEHLRGLRMTIPCTT